MIRYILHGNCVHWSKTSIWGTYYVQGHISKFLFNWYNPKLAKNCVWNSIHPWSSFILFWSFRIECAFCFSNFRCLAWCLAWVFLVGSFRLSKFLQAFPFLFVVSRICQLELFEIIVYNNHIRLYQLNENYLFWLRSRVYPFFVLPKRNWIF